MDSIDDQADSVTSDIDSALQTKVGLLNVIVSESAPEDWKVDDPDEQKALEDMDTDIASETEDIQDIEGHHNNTRVLSPPNMSLPSSSEETHKKDQGVQVEVEFTMKHELKWLRQQNKNLQKEIKTLREAVEKGSVTKSSTTNPMNGSRENEYSWKKKLSFYTRLTLDQCSVLYDNLDMRGREVVLSTISGKNSKL